MNSILDPVTNPAARVDSRADRFSRVVVPALAVRQDSTYASLEAVAESSTIVPYTSFAPGATFLSAGLVDRRDPFASVPVDLLFGNHGLGGGSALIAWTSPIVNEVVLGYSYTSSTDSDFQAGTLAHELLHIAVNRRLSHKDIADELGVPYKKDESDVQVGKDITDWIKNGCPDKQ